MWSKQAVKSPDGIANGDASPLACRQPDIPLPAWAPPPLPCTLLHPLCMMILQTAARCAPPLVVNLVAPLRAFQVPTLGVSVREVLRAEYIATASRIGPQPEAGHNGQMHAVWTHRCGAGSHKRRHTDACMPSVVDGLSVGSLELKQTCS